MKIALLGANGRTGRLVMRRALAAGDKLTGLVRSADSLSDIQHGHLQVRVGDVCDPEFLKTVLPGHDAVISTVGPRAPTKSACTIYPCSAAAIAEAMQATGLKRVVITSTALLFPPSGLFDHLVRVIARNNQEAAAQMEDRISDAGLEWTFARTGFLTDSEEEKFKKAEGAMPEGGGSISRSALARFLFTELKKSEHIGDVVGLCGVRATKPERRETE